eukprot:GHVS01025526.1.p1 GENE.GHVS01025526.1~~GHVS01025526.1.p1  ORF type:complete len:429 (-),score=112.35 GHVS01025526.1:234-1520(-)
MSPSSLLWCPRVLPCGHRCGGTEGEWKEEAADRLLQDRGAGGGGRAVWLGRCVCNICSYPLLCPICLDPLSSQPSLQLSSCQHRCHHACLKASCTSHQPRTAPLDFAHLNCPQCRTLCADHPCLAREEDIQLQLQLRRRVLRAALLQCRVEGLRTAADCAITTGEEAVRHVNFYICANCQQPFYGGRRECVQEEPPASSSSSAPELPRCLKCSSNTSTCNRHGNGGINFKCRFCCNIASWFCFGTTHYCCSCHSRGSDPSPVPCQGPSACPLHISHPPNPCELSLGCSVCHDEFLLGQQLPAPPSAETADQQYVQQMHSKIAQEALKHHWEIVNQHMEHVENMRSMQRTIAAQHNQFHANFLPSSALLPTVIAAPWQPPSSELRERRRGVAADQRMAAEGAAVDNSNGEGEEEEEECVGRGGGGGEAR